MLVQQRVTILCLFFNNQIRRLTMSEFKVGDLVRGKYSAKDNIDFSYGITNPDSICEIIDIDPTAYWDGISALKVQVIGHADPELYESAVKHNFIYWVDPARMVKLDLPYSKMLKKHGHKKSWNTVLPKPSLEPKVGSFVKIVGNTGRFKHFLRIGSYGEITAKSADNDGAYCYDIIGDLGHCLGLQYVFPQDFKVLI